MFFSGNLLDPDILQSNVTAFLSFCLMAGAVYIFNDMNDYKSDRLHPEKRSRPLASGTVSIQSARILLTGMATAAFLTSYIISSSLSLILFIYLFLNILYSRWLKKYALPAVLIVASGYILRVLAGAEASSVEASAWILVLTFLLSLLIGFNKKEADADCLKPDSRSHSKFQKALTLSVSLFILIIYALWSLNPGVQQRLGSEYLWITSIFVFIGLTRYTYLILVKNESKNPVNLFIHDLVLMGSSTGWGITLFILLYS
jgi:4-hydroxybenzoate polyprenyltransferase